MEAIERDYPTCVREFVEPVRAIEKYRELYRDIIGAGTQLQYSDRHALGDLAVMIVESEILRGELYEKGDAMEVNGDKGNVVTKKNPARDALEKLRPKIHAMMREFKMTPGSRKSVITNPGSGGSSLDAEFEDF